MGIPQLEWTPKGGLIPPSQVDTPHDPQDGGYSDEEATTQIYPLVAPINPLMLNLSLAGMTQGFVTPAGAHPGFVNLPAHKNVMASQQLVSPLPFYITHGGSWESDEGTQ